MISDLIFSMPTHPIPQLTGGQKKAAGSPLFQLFETGKLKRWTTPSSFAKAALSERVPTPVSSLAMHGDRITQKTDSEDRAEKKNKKRTRGSTSLDGQTEGESEWTAEEILALDVLRRAVSDFSASTTSLRKQQEYGRKMAMMLIPDRSYEDVRARLKTIQISATDDKKTAKKPFQSEGMRQLLKMEQASTKSAAAAAASSVETVETESAEDEDGKRSAEFERKKKSLDTLLGLATEEDGEAAGEEDVLQQKRARLDEILSAIPKD
ncbi:hypothetical protein BZA70DRAFT_43893 [Myxozyma melibiosi]|uniref:Uncharacterized protein n=1 Tax=Myxozyma melibiosi TaxID=54550 RepID=A0ABR1FEW7_9ASCO